MSQIGILQIYAGKNIPAIDRIKLFSPDEWEEFIEEWLSSKKDMYSSIERLGGSGDQGRDVVGYKEILPNGSYIWDNYQCKHYDHALMPSDVWIEIGKLCYFTFIGDFPLPERYFFVGPRGVGTSLSNMLINPNKLKSEFIKNWDNYCKDKITKNTSIDLSPEFNEYIDTIDFSIFNKLTPLMLIEEHSITPYHIARFGGGLPARPVTPQAPKIIGKQEQLYIESLLNAYGSDSSNCYKIINEVDVKYKGHLDRSRENFYSAEQLKQFSRDILPPGIFESLKEEIYSGTIDVYENDHTTGFVCVKAVEGEAKKIAINSNPLSLYSTIKDRMGICHHLANEGIYKWVK
ncbi:TPA: hypothetical protein KEY91_002723 [Proteus mirabilis]|uniref:ABC-three component system protein n=1 Tax=Proteus mirabilis TaxID=584 RepID=UPI000283353C|nr:ABC-three component system protein [Proteus mirabilis]EJD6084798.1 hypothetical protein [Proteus mirabilis]EKA98623.1 hypothetical protein HMPREF1310_01185 [Proteus mirabilis WGLW4]ELT8661314.1 hypothetical protein [Proteus mirabilis]KAB7718418.1 hypothetical protein GBN13_17350 [Proteus mirabilis]MBG2804874.1 hypothetical protein [Proteus mirabilis]